MNAPPNGPPPVKYQRGNREVSTQPILDSLLMRNFPLWERRIVAGSVTIGLLIVAIIVSDFIGGRSRTQPAIAQASSQSTKQTDVKRSEPEPKQTAQVSSQPPAQPDEKRSEPEPKPTASRIKVTSKPAGARVKVDGKDVGKAPVEVSLRGNEVIMAEFVGYEPTTQTYVATRDAGPVLLTLQPKPAVFTVNVDPPDARLVVDNVAAQVSGSGSERLVTVPNPDPERPLTVLVSRDGYAPAEKVLTASPDVRVTCSIELISNDELWQVVNLKSRHVSLIEFLDRNANRSNSGAPIKPDAGEVILELSGLFTEPKKKKPSLLLSDIALHVTSSGRTKKFAVSAIGLTDAKQHTFYVTPELPRVSNVLYSGVGSFFIMTLDGAWSINISDRFTLLVGQRSENEPTIVGVTNPKTPLSIAFKIPKDPKATYELRVGTRKVPVPVPSPVVDDPKPKADDPKPEDVEGTPDNELMDRIAKRLENSKRQIHAFYAKSATGAKMEVKNGTDVSWNNGITAWHTGVGWCWSCQFSKLKAGTVFFNVGPHPVTISEQVVAKGECVVLRKGRLVKVDIANLEFEERQ